MGDKFDLYEKHGAREYWMVDIEAQYIAVYRREGERLVRQGVYSPGETFVSSLLGGAAIEVNRLLGLSGA